MEQRDPYYYQIAVMIHPQCYASPTPRGHRGLHVGIGGEAKNYARVENKTPPRAMRGDKQGDKMVSLQQPDNRLQDSGCQWKKAPPTPTKKRKLKLKKKRKKKKKVTKCGACQQPGHNKSKCPELEQKESHPAGSTIEAVEW